MANNIMIGYPIQLYICAIVTKQWNNGNNTLKELESSINKVACANVYIKSDTNNWTKTISTTSLYHLHQRNLNCDTYNQFLNGILSTTYK